MQVWTMERAPWSRRFYERRGGVLFGTGAAVLGDHRVPHVGYRLTL